MTKRRELRRAWWIAALALAIRAFFAWQYVSAHPARALATIPFLLEPGNIAASLASGNGFSSPFRVDTGPTAWMTPIYPLLLAAIFRIFGTLTIQAFVADVSLNALCSSLACVPLLLAGTRLRGIGAGTTAALLWAFLPSAVLLTYESIWDVSLSALLAATLLWATLALRDSKGTGRSRDWLLYGLLWGIALMTNAAFIVPLPFCFAGLRRFPAGQHALASLAIVLCCLPWTVRNFAVLHAFVPLRSNAGIALWLGNNDDALSRPQGWLHPISNPRERERYTELGELAYSAEKQRLAVTYMTTHPAEELRLTAGRIGGFWAGGSLRIRTLRGGLVVPCNLFLAAGGLAGLLLLWRRGSPALLPFCAFLLVYPLLYYVTLAIPRYRLLADPAAIVLTAYALTDLANYKQRPSGPRVVK